MSVPGWRSLNVWRRSCSGRVPAWNIGRCRRSNTCPSWLFLWWWIDLPLHPLLGLFAWSLFGTRSILLYQLLRTVVPSGLFEVRDLGLALLLERVQVGLLTGNPPVEEQGQSLPDDVDDGGCSGEASVMWPRPLLGAKDQSQYESIDKITNCCIQSP